MYRNGMSMSDIARIYNCHYTMSTKLVKNLVKWPGMTRTRLENTSPSAPIIPQSVEFYDGEMCQFDNSKKIRHCWGSFFWSAC